MRGIILAGGSGTRLHPLTISTNKHLLPIHDKPMIFYPLATLMLAGISKITIVTNSKDVDRFKSLLEFTSKLGMSLEYVIQEKPLGIVHGLKLALGDREESTCLILGDNILYGSTLGSQLQNFQEINQPHIFAYRVSNPQDYGVIEFNSEDEVVSIREKPEFTKSNWAIPGIYFLPSNLGSYLDNFEYSERGEMEITTLLSKFLAKGLLKVVKLPRGTVWLDTGTFQGISDASTFVRIIEERQGMRIASLQEIAFRNKWITKDELQYMLKRLPARESEYLKLLILEDKLELN